MTIDSMYVYEGLLRYNYFPMVKEHRDDIPPLFSTEDFTAEIADKLIERQNAKSSKDKDLRGNDGFDQIEYRTTRFNNVLRLMHIPHPNPYARLCKCIHDNWDNIKHICDNDYSVIKPSRHDSRVVVIAEYESIELGRLVVMGRDRFPDDLMRYLDLSSGTRYSIDADVSSCFPSLYTHALPWALVGHESAKKDKKSGHWFNKLDSCQRYLKRNETQGVPVGPATSNLVNEIILCKVDEALAKKKYKFFRIIDDFKCYAKTREEAEAFVRDLEQELSKYLLLLNAKKVSISELPLPAKSDWISDLMTRLPPEENLKAQHVAIFLDSAVTLQRQNPQGSIIKYAARVLSGKVNKDNVEVYFRYLLQLTFHYPAILPIICESFKKWLVPLDGEYLNSMVANHLEFRRSDAVSWGLYLLRLTKKKISVNLAKKVVDSGDCMTMATLLGINRHTDLVIEFVKSLRSKHHYEFDKYWLLIYELIRSGHFGSDDFDKYVEKTGLQILIDEDVAFIRKLSLLKRNRVGFPQADQK
ncbi:MAG: RNA-directed DNA polymerase [Deltaproteobacteria bacterium]|nr:MAG: RNA-directed DNA polymerase [Deltaproteobacteria bacterium]